jgi:hypothetical protein
MKYNPSLGDEGSEKMIKKYGGKIMIWVAPCSSSDNAVRDLAVSIQNTQLRSRVDLASIWDALLMHKKKKGLWHAPLRIGKVVYRAKSWRLPADETMKCKAPCGERSINLATGGDEVHLE